jgi:hypothetical protein
MDMFGDYLNNLPPAIARDAPAARQNQEAMLPLLNNAA